MRGTAQNFAGREGESRAQKEDFLFTLKGFREALVQLSQLTVPDPQEQLLTALQVQIYRSRVT